MTLTREDAEKIRWIINRHLHLVKNEDWYDIDGIMGEIAKVFSTNAVLKVTRVLPKENKKEKPEVAVCLHEWIDMGYYEDCAKCGRRRD